MNAEALELIARMEAGMQYARAVEVLFEEATRLSKSPRVADQRDAINVAWRAVKLRQDARKECYA